MKRIITLWGSLFFIVMAFAQADQASLDGINPSETERNATLNALYEEARILENQGTPAEIQANRLAIKAAWQQVNPEIAALYKHINAITYDRFGFNGTPYVPEKIVPRPEVPPSRDWDTDRLIREDFIDGVDMEVTLNGDLYIGVYENIIDTGGSEDFIYIYKSTDSGANWELWQQQEAASPIRKLQLVLISGSGEKYLLAFSMFDSGLFQAGRWNLDTGVFSFDTIDNGVSDFGVDRNYPGVTANQRVFATYLKDDACSAEVYSARSTAGSYGFDWVDAVSIDNVCGAQIEFAYGRNGGCYTVYTGAGSGNLYVSVNTNLNDPASWMARETITTGAMDESVDPTIKAARKGVASDEVLVVTSQRDPGTTDGYRYRAYRRESGAPFVSIFNGVPLANQSAGHPDLWIRKSNDVEEIQAIRVVDIVDDAQNDALNSRPYNGDNMPDFSRVSDSDIDVWDGFAAAVAETNDNLPCVAFVGTSGGIFPYGLYYDAETELLSAEENRVEGLTFYPNPMDEVLHISANTTLEDIRVFNVLGAPILQISTEGNQKSISTTSLPSGIYFVQVTSEGKTETIKIVKQ
ncbi:MAG: T9SS type A sorting domain-containing protein [Bacteroidota bacterium]